MLLIAYRKVHSYNTQLIPARVTGISKMDMVAHTVVRSCERQWQENHKLFFFFWWGMTSLIHLVSTRPFRVRE